MSGQFLLDARQVTLIAMAFGAIRADVYGLIAEHQRVMTELVRAEKTGEIVALLHSLRNQYEHQIEVM